MSFFPTVIFFIILFALIALFARAMVGHGKIGTNFARTACARCSTPLPVFRMPTSLKQAFWGGWTCSNCGCEMDRSGKEIPKSTSPG